MNNWRTASTSISTSGATLFQTAWIDVAGNIVSFNGSVGSKVEKYLKNDFTEALFKLIPNPYLFLLDNTSAWKSVDGSDFNSTISKTGIPASYSFYDYSASTIKNNVLIVQPLDDGTSKSNVYYSTDFGSTFTVAISAQTGYDIGNFKQSQNYFWIKKAASPTPKLAKSSDGITWTETGYVSTATIKAIAEFGSSIVFCDGTNQLFVSNDNGASFTSYTMYNDDSMTYNYNIKYIEVRNVSGVDRLYFAYEKNNIMSYMTSQGSGFITSVPSANDWTWTTIAASEIFIDGAYMQQMDTYIGKTVKFSKSGTNYTFLMWEGAAGTSYVKFPEMIKLNGPYTYYQAGWYDKVKEKMYIIVNDDLTPNLTVQEVNLATNGLTDVTSQFSFPVSIFSQPSVVWEK